MTEQPKPRGFASMPPEKRKRIAAKGGRAVQQNGKGHRWTQEKAAEAGRKGGRNRKAKKADGAHA